MTWRYLAFSEPDGAYLGEVEIVGAEVTRTLSGPGRLTGTIPAGLVPQWLTPWGCSLYAEDAGGTIRGGGLLTPYQVDGDGAVSIDCVGRSGYASRMPWTGTPQALVQVDPLDIVRMIWAHLQAQPGGNLRVVVDATRSPVRVGEEERDVSFTTGSGEQVEFTAGPYRLEWWSTHDLGRAIDDLARDTPFDYLEHTAWDSGGVGLVHRLQLGYPTIGARRSDLRLAVGENVTAAPPLAASDADYASEVLALGAGEGRAMVHATLTRSTGGVRRVAVYTDKTARSTSVLSAGARADLDWRDGEPRIENVSVIDSPLAPLSAITPGDEVRIIAPESARWVRIVEVAVQPESDVASLRVVEV